MEPGVPFAVLGTTALLTVAAWAALGATGLALGGRRAAGAVLGLGGGLLAGIEVVTAVRFGDSGSDRLALLRAAGGLLLTAGLALGALGARPARGPVPVAAPGVVVPLAAAPAAAVLAGLSLLAAAGATLRSRRDPAGVLLAAGLAVSAASVLAAPLGDDGPGQALALLLVRSGGAVLVLVALVLLAQTSLLAKVVATMLAGVLAMAAAAVGVVGTVVVQAYERQAGVLVSQRAVAAEQALRELRLPLLLPSQQLEPLCRESPVTCARALQVVGPDRPTFAVRVPAGGQPALSAEQRVRLTPTEVLGLARVPAVRTALSGTTVDPVPALVRLAGPQERLAVLSAAPPEGARRDRPPSSVLVYGLVLDTTVLADTLLEPGYGLTLLTGDPPRLAAGDGQDPAGDVDVVARATRLLAERPRPDGVTVVAVGTAPTLRLEPLRDEDGTLLGYLVVTRDARDALRDEQQALTRLLLAAVATTALVAVLAVPLGRRTVDPVRRLTAAAQRLAAGDLRGGTALAGSRDEVGTLSRTFDTMTGALARLTGDLRSSASRLETVLASMSDGLIATDGDGRVTAVNRAALEMLGAPDASAVVGRPLPDVADVRDGDGAPLADAALRVQDVAAEVHRADGTTVPVRVGVTGLVDTEGAVLVLRDTTREREVERMKTEFLSNVSHELRTPLTPIRGYADLLVSRPGLAPDKVAMMAGTILAESLKMNRVVDLLVDVASLEAGRVSVRPADVDVQALLDGRLEVWRARVPERAGDLRRRLAARLPTVHVDPEWVAKALDELVDNALKYTPAGTAVTLTAAMAPDGARVRVAVRDAGAGIAEADRALLFTSFEQVDGSATRRVGGLGLGLSFVRRLAEDAGFPLTVSSQVGRGSEFALDLPAGSPSAPRPRRAVSPASRAART